MLNCVTLRRITQYCFTLRYITPHYVVFMLLSYRTTSCRITLRRIALRCITSHYFTLRYITLHCVALRYIASHYVALLCITLHYVTLRYIALNKMPQFYPSFCRFILAFATLYASAPSCSSILVRELIPAQTCSFHRWPRVTANAELRRSTKTSWRYLRLSFRLSASLPAFDAFDDDTIEVRDAFH